MHLHTQEKIDLKNFDLPARIVELEKSANEFWIILAGFIFF